MADEEKSKLHIDDDWKTQVEKEKEQLRQQQAGEAAAEQPTETEASPAEDTPADADSFQMPEMPPASFPVLIMMLSTQALGALGMAPGPNGKPMPPQLPLAKHFIDTLAVLEEKTKGNLDAQEEQMLGESLNELRLAYVQANKA